MPATRAPFHNGDGSTSLGFPVQFYTRLFARLDLPGAHGSWLMQPFKQVQQVSFDYWNLAAGYFDFGFCYSVLRQGMPNTVTFNK